MTKWAVTPESHTLKACTQGGMSVTDRGGLSYIFEPWNAAVIINSPAFSYSTLVVTRHQKEKTGKKEGIIVIFLLY